MYVTSANASKFEIKVNRKPYKDDDLLDMVQRYTTRYFFDFAEPFTGMARERSNDVNGDIVTTGGTGFGLMALIAGMERSYFPREKGLEVMKKLSIFSARSKDFTVLGHIGATPTREKPLISASTMTEVIWWKLHC